MSSKPVAVIVGGGSGIGADAARKMHEIGYDVAVMSSSGKGEALGKELGGLGFTGSNLVFADLEAFDAAIMNQFGRIDAVINCAGHGPKGDLLSISDEDWQAVVGDQAIAKPGQIYEAVGCDSCRNTGYKGRAGIYEMLKVDNNITTLIRDEANARDLRESAIESGMNMLRISGAIKVAEGKTTLEEVFRVTPSSSV